MRGYRCYGCGGLFTDFDGVFELKPTMRLPLVTTEMYLCNNCVGRLRKWFDEQKSEEGNNAVR